jgi:hypothetical protein
VPGSRSIPIHRRTSRYARDLVVAAVLATASRLLAAAAAGFALATLGGYLLSLWVGLFGFTEIRTTAGIVALPYPRSSGIRWTQR